MREYIPKMKAALYRAVAPKTEPPLVIAALHPKMLALAASEARGTHTYFCLPEHTKRAREVMGPDAWVCPSVIAILEQDAAKARAGAKRAKQPFDKRFVQGSSRHRHRYFMKVGRRAETGGHPRLWSLLEMSGESRAPLPDSGFVAA
jgi:alkanesulfonate monooxygenase SsuD/methylene tetrahydromethanopterin reductase-like flavin-dependent oxidoreductase (luciferase family)